MSILSSIYFNFQQFIFICLDSRIFISITRKLLNNSGKQINIFFSSAIIKFIIFFFIFNAVKQKNDGNA